MNDSGSVPLQAASNSTSHRLSHCRTYLLIAGVAAGTLSLVGAAEAVPASVYLTAANLYAANPSDGSSSSFGYRYTTSANDGGGFLTVTDTNGTSNTASSSPLISFALVPGSNTFTFTDAGSNNVPPGGGNGLNLFFDASSTPYDPPNDPTDNATGIPGDLTVAVGDGSTNYLTPALNTEIERYNHWGGDGGADSGAYGAHANGYTSYPVGDQTVTITAFTVGGSAGSYNEGSFTVFVAPEPATLGLLVMGGTGLLMRRRRRA
jgi:hypothetical protein